MVLDDPCERIIRPPKGSRFIRTADLDNPWAAGGKFISFPLFLFVGVGGRADSQKERKDSWLKISIKFQVLGGDIIILVS